MADINLLPEELREKEKKEIEAAGKQGRASAMKMSQPRPEPLEPTKPARPRLSLWARFGGKKKAVTPKPAPVVTVQPASPKSRSEPGQGEQAHRDPKPAPMPTVAPDLLAASAGQAERNGSRGEPSPAPVVKARPLPPPPPVPPSEPVPVAPASSSDRAKPKRTFRLFSRRSHEAKDRKLEPRDTVTTPAAEAPSDQTNLDVNLIPEGLANQEEQNFLKRLVRSGGLVALTLAVVGLAYLGIIWYKVTVNRQVDGVTAEVNQLEGTIAAIQADTERAGSLQQRLDLVSGLLDRHQYWTELFAILEAHTIDDVYYTNFSMAGTEKVVLTAVGKDYQSVARQLVAFQQASDAITGVEINSALANLDDAGNYQDVNFTINLTLNPDVFRR